ncbi:hypothetical protein Tcan_16302 [Toxocara canis]|uniref:G protein-coupled receptor n=1 Tax=Toxocara canis TaxID=6265 RepID=A0A0B2VWE7_TOXCA|nr:hypothetical protein Tcan_16302 [Toxocara canis]
MSESDFDDFHLYAKAPLWSVYTQLFFDAVALCAALILFAAIALRKIFYRNLVALLANVQAAYIIYTLSRFYMIVAAHCSATPPRSVYAFTCTINLFSLNAAAMNLLAVVAERISAVMFVRVYERFGASIPLYGICLGLVQWAASVVIVSLKIQRSMSQFIVVGIWFCSHLLAAVIFMILPKITKRMYERKMRELRKAGSNHMLSEQFQLSENVKTVALLRPVILLIGVTSCIVPLLFILLDFSPYEQAAVFETSIHLQMPIEAIVLTSVFLARCSHLRMAIVRWLRRSNAVAPSEYPPRSLNGDNLVVPVEDEGRVYFEALAISWAWRRQ